MRNGLEELALVATIDSQTVTTEVFSDVIDMSKYLEVIAFFNLGNMAADNVVIKAYRCDSGGSNAAAIKTKTLTGNASANDDTQVKMLVRGEDLLPQATYNRYVKFGLANSGGSGGPASMVAVATISRYTPASDLASVSASVSALDG